MTIDNRIFVLIFTPHFYTQFRKKSRAGIHHNIHAYNRVMLRSPPISVILVSWNSKTHLPRCLFALSKLALQDFEVILVNKDSEGGKLDELHEEYPAFDMQIHRLSSHLGFTVAENKSPVMGLDSLKT